jgi:8-amino-7-oxononanoate synthase
MLNASHNLIRTRRVITSRSEASITFNNKQMINFAGNDYLGLAQDSRIQQSFISSINEFGFGSTSSPMLSGYSRAHQALEEYFTEFSGRERALFFNSGYHANLGVVTTFANRNTPVIADKHCHASIIDAVTLSRAPHHRFHHHDHDHAESLLQQHNHHGLLISESVFSMTGTITNTAQLAMLAKKYHKTLVIDDAHVIGVIGERGRGESEYFNLNTNDLPLLVTPFGKAIAGMGAMVSGSCDMIEYLLQHARTYCYSTALPPAVCAANLQALQIIHQESWRIARLQELISFFNRQAKARNLSLLSSDMTPIKCIVTRDNQKTIAMQEKLSELGLFVAAIRPPTVPANTARLRISLSTAHTEQDITLLLDLLADLHANQTD